MNNNKFNNTFYKIKTAFFRLSLKNRIVFLLSLFFIVFGTIYMFNANKYSYGADNSTLKDFGNFTNMNSIIESVSATKKTGNYLDLDSKFEIKTKEDIEADELKNHLAISPAIDYKIEKTNNSSFLLVPNQNIPANTLINVISVEEGNSLYKWAFESEKILTVKSTYPYNNGTIGTKGIIEIVLTYPDVINFEDCFYISDDVKGKFEHDGYIYRFIPESNLEVNKTYDVVIKKGLTNNTHTMNEDYNFSFSIYQNSVNYDKFEFTSSNLDQSLVFTEDEKPKIGINLKEASKNAEIASINLYRLNMEEYANLENNEKIDLSTLELFDNFTAKINKYDGTTYSYDYLAYIEYPKTLPLGYYIASYEIEGTIRTQFMQISNIVAYVGNTEKDIIIWANDYKTKGAIEGIPVTFNNKSVLTNEDGIAIIKNKYNEGDNFVYIKNKNDELLVKLKPLSETYYNGFIYTDRTLYKKTDKINVWGFIPSKNLKNNKNYYIKFLDTKYSINVNEDGIFSTEIPISNVNEQYYNIRLFYDDVSIASRNIQIEEYVTPNYIYTIDTDKNVYKNGDSIKVEITAEHISGVKAVDKQLQIIYENQNISCITDSLGRCKVTLTASNNSKYYSATSEQTIRVRPVDAIDSEDLCHKSITIINEEKEIKVTSNSRNGNFYIEVKGNNLSIENGLLKSINNLNAKVKVEIIEHSYDIKEITKINEYTKEKYTYKSYQNYNQTLIKTVYYDLKNGNLKITDLYYPSIKNDDKYKLYSFEIALDDSKLHKSLYYYVNNSTKKEDLDSNYTSACPNYYCFWNYSYYKYNSSYFSNLDNNMYNIKEEINTSINNYKREKITDRRLIYVFDSEIIDYYFDKEKIEYKKEYIPGTIIAGASFDGNKNYMVDAKYLKYDDSLTDLNITLTTDKNIYSPQSDVNLNIKVVDENNNPIKTDVLISVVNEGIFVLSEDYFNTKSLFESKYFGFYQFSTYQDLAKFNYIGGIGAAAGAPRSDFGDTVYFKNVKTDSNGNASVTFKLNDSITTFRITAIAINKDLYNGSTKIKIKSQLPYFIENSNLEGFKPTDDFVVATNTLSNNDLNANYTFDLDGTDYQNTGTTNKYIYQNFGKINSGSHSLNITSFNDNYKDAVSYKFNIKDYYNQVRIESNDLLVNGIQKIGIDSDTIDIELYDKSLSFYLKLVSNLTYYGGDRLDQYIAKKKGSELYNKYNKTNIYTNISIPTKFIKNNELYLLENSEFSPLLNALTVNYASNMLNNSIIDSLKSKTINYLKENDINEKDYFEYIVLASSLKIISLEELRNIKALDIKDNINLALAFSFLGDYDNAIRVYNEKIVNKEYYDDNKDIIAVLLSLIKSDECRKLLIEMIDSTSEYYTFAMLSYLENSAPFVENIVVNVNGEDYTLNKLSVTNFKFKKEELETLNITSNSNDVMIRKVYYGSPKEIEEESKIYSVKLDIEKELKLNEIYNLTVSIDNMPSKRCGTLYVVLPKGIRYYSIGAEYDYNAFLISNKNNVLTYNICTNSNHSINFKIPIVTTLEGNYIFESSVYKHNTYYGVSDEFKLTIIK